MTLKGNGRCPNSRRSAGPPLRAQAMSAPEGQVEAVDQEILALLPIHPASGKRCAQRRHVAAGGSISREANPVPSPKGPREPRKRPPPRERHGRRQRISCTKDLNREVSGKRL